MITQGKSIRIRVDGYTRFCLTVIAGLLTVLILGLWANSVPSASPVQAADQPFGDAAAQRQASVDAQKETNAKLDELIQVLKSGEVKVQVAQTESAGGKDSGTGKK